MIPIHFEANFLPTIRKFRIQIHTPENRWVELMTRHQFLRWVRKLDEGPIVVGGITVRMLSGKKEEQAIKDYFKMVAKAYVQTHHKR